MLRPPQPCRAISPRFRPPCAPVDSPAAQPLPTVRATRSVARTVKKNTLTAALEHSSACHFSRVTTRLSLHDFLKSAENVFLLSQLCSSGHGAWGQSVPHAGELLKQPVSSRSGQVCPRSCPKCRAQKAPLIWAKVGVLRRVRENVVKSGHVVGLGSSLVLNPSRESKPIGYVDNSGRLQSEACRFTHGAGWKRFLRLQCTSLSLTRAEKVDLPAWIDVHA